MAKHKGKKHTGPMHHSDMGSYLKNKGCKDGDAHCSHHEMNKRFGMGKGMSPEETLSTTSEGMS